MLLTIVFTLLIFGVIILIHEFGHFICAKSVGITVHEFSMGMGPKIFSKQKGETLYSVRLFPIGGFVQMEGEDEESDKEGSFNKVSIPKRALVLAAGAILNLILGLILLFIININSRALSSTTVAVFNEGATSSQDGGLQVGDEILKVNGTKIHIAQDMIYQFTKDQDGKVDFQVRRDGEVLTLNQVPFKQEPDQDGNNLIQLDFKVKAIENGFLASLKYSFKEAVSTAKIVWQSLGDLVTGNVPINQLSGPVGVAQVVGQAAQMGWMSILSIAAFLTINVGVFNLLPFPALDGGRLFFLAVEAIRGKPIKQEHEGWVHAIGMILLLSLMALVTFKDIWNLF